MKKSRLLITILLSLFMFQSFWNVAAVFCGHETSVKTSSNMISNHHFGHHEALGCRINDLSNNSKSADSNTAKHVKFKFDIVDDHSDHLPSFAHFIVLEVRKDAVEPVFATHQIQQDFDWKNLYQSPHLFLNNPPPVLSPL
ncbi:cation efflux protein, CzcI-like [Acinetobacter stercoris]|uniref:Cation transporter n=1 Tax=Acinetobacter stercoris TaxID=2126983 RepID=A0A2U3N062_9GAMM|nr:hypothetical protein KPC_2236 [Acinetobacter stercoris]